MVNIHFAKTNLSKLVERAEAGEVIILARNGVPAAKLVPLVDEDRAPARRLGVRASDNYWRSSDLHDWPAALADRIGGR